MNTMSRKISNVLIVDDDQVDVKAIKRGFSKMDLDCPIQWAKDGMEALALLRDNETSIPRNFHASTLLLVDINMPRMGGVEFLQKMEEEGVCHNCLIYILTTANKAEEIQSTYNFDIAGYIIKEDIENGIDQLIQQFSMSS